MNRLKFERIRHHLSQERLAWLAKLQQPTISLIENGTWNPTADQLAAIAAVLHVDPPERLLDEIVPADSQSRVAACTEP